MPFRTSPTETLPGGSSEAGVRGVGGADCGRADSGGSGLGAALGVAGGAETGASAAAGGGVGSGPLVGGRDGMNTVSVLSSWSGGSADICLPQTAVETSERRVISSQATVMAVTL